MVARKEANSAQCQTNPEGERRHSQAEPGISLSEHLRIQSPPGDVHLVLTTQSANKERATLTTCTSHRSHQRLLLGLNDWKLPRPSDPAQTQLPELSYCTALWVQKESAAGKPISVPSPVFLEMASVNSVLMNPLFSQTQPFPHLSNVRKHTDSTPPETRDALSALHMASGAHCTGLQATKALSTGLSGAHCCTSPSLPLDILHGSLLECSTAHVSVVQSRYAFHWTKYPIIKDQFPLFKRFTVHRWYSFEGGGCSFLTREKI